MFKSFFKSSNASDRISITGHYTGAAWYHHGMSKKLFLTPEGRLMYFGMRPINHISHRLIGMDVDTTLLQRHEVLDYLIADAIRDRQVHQIVEIAAGLSPRGTMFEERFEGTKLLYVEADLAPVAKRKARLLDRSIGPNPNHKIVACDILAKSGEQSLEHIFKTLLDPSKPVVVVTEGLVNYFPLDTLSDFWQRLAKCLKLHPFGVYFTDLYPQLPDHPAAWWLESGRRLLQIAARGSVHFHFASEAAIENHFQSLGFDQTLVHAPENFSDKVALPQTKIPSVVRVIENRIE